MELALSEATDWRVDSGYGIRPNAVFRDGWQNPDKNHTHQPILWKLHGSTNWITSYEQIEDGKIILIQEASPESVNVFDTATKAYACYAGRYMPGFGRFTYGYYPPNLVDKGRAAAPGHVSLDGATKVSMGGGRRGQRVGG